MLNYTTRFKLPLPDQQTKLTPNLAALAWALDDVLSTFGAAYWKAPVANVGALPGFGNTTGDVRQTLDTQELWTWNGGAWVLVAGGTDFVGWFTQAGKPTAAQVPDGKYAFWYQTGPGKLRLVARYAGDSNLYGVQLSVIP